MSSQIKSLDDARKARTNARRTLTVAANSVKNAVKFNMPTMNSFVSKLDNAMQVFLDTCLTFNYFAEKEKADPEATTVSKMTIEEYEYDADRTYTEAVEVYNEYKRLQEEAAAAARPPPIQPPVQPVQEGTGAGVYFKKRDLPTFSGQRRHWSEFKSLWTELVEKQITNRLALASELKKACQGDALREIQDISAGSVDSYQIMWDKLCHHYDNLTLSVFSSLEEIKSLKPVKGDTDYAGLISLIKGVASVYKQLEVLGQVNKVTAKEVTQIHYMLPPAVGREWAIKFSDLTDEQRLEPFPHLYNFLISQEKTAKLMSDTYVAAKTTTSGGPQSSTKKVSAHVTSFATCFVHPNEGQHTTNECRFFLGLSAKQKRNY